MKPAYKIEKGVPVPPRAKGAGLAAALRSMVEGDSLVIPRQSRSGVYAFAWRFGIKITTREQPGGNYRIWRIK
jgi:hypothetical protein